MIQSQFIHTIKVLRFARSGYNDFNEPTFSSSSIAFGSSNEIPARVEIYEDKTEYRDSNKRNKNKTLIYLPPSIILQEDDYVVWGTKRIANTSLNDAIGTVVGVNPAVLGTSTTIDHYEIIIENP